jgi:hypothetical protein
MEALKHAWEHEGSRRGFLSREFNTLLMVLCLAITAYIVAYWGFPAISDTDLVGLMVKFVGVSWPFFSLVSLFLLYVVGAWLAEVFALGGGGRKWNGIRQALFWSTEACPLVGLLTTFLSLLTALLAYGEAGPGKPETQAAFITQFAIAFGSSIAGGVLALTSFTLHRILPDTAEVSDNEEA